MHGKEKENENGLVNGRAMMVRVFLSDGRAILFEKATRLSSRVLMHVSTVFVRLPERSCPFILVLVPRDISS